MTFRLNKGGRIGNDGCKVRRKIEKKHMRECFGDNDDDDDEQSTGHLSTPPS